jgi:hypothetical protein
MAFRDRKWMTLVGGALFGVALALGGANGVQAQELEDSYGRSGGIKDASPQQRHMMISAFTGIHYGHHAGYGFPLVFAGRFYVPLVPNGFIPSINDEFGIEPGLDFVVTFLDSIYNDSTAFGMNVPVDAVWDFHITPSFDAYGKLGFVFGTVFGDYYGDFWWTFRTAVGMKLKMSEAVYFRAEVGWPALLVGFGFAL